METRLGASDFARQRGGRVLALTVPCAVKSRMSLETGFVFDMLNGWAKPMALPVEEKKALLADPDRRREMNDLAEGPSPMRGIAKWHQLTIGDVYADANREPSGPHDRRDRRR